MKYIAWEEMKRGGIYRSAEGKYIFVYLGIGTLEEKIGKKKILSNSGYIIIKLKAGEKIETRLNGKMMIISDYCRYNGDGAVSKGLLVKKRKPYAQSFIGYAFDDEIISKLNSGFIVGTNVKDRYFGFYDYTLNHGYKKGDLVYIESDIRGGKVKSKALVLEDQKPGMRKIRMDVEDVNGMKHIWCKVNISDIKRMLYNINS